MWVLLFVAVLNAGGVILDAKPMSDKASCEAKAAEINKKAQEADAPVLAKCKKLEIM